MGVIGGVSWTTGSEVDRYIQGLMKTISDQKNEIQTLSDTLGHALDMLNGETLRDDELIEKLQGILEGKR